ncbi:hypothetical protein MRB53_037859 [Persea americana]|nr:hypothetical protein MRB53_037859 [Persea americana]
MPKQQNNTEAKSECSNGLPVFGASRMDIGPCQRELKRQALRMKSRSPFEDEDVHDSYDDEILDKSFRYGGQLVSCFAQVSHLSNKHSFARSAVVDTVVGLLSSLLPKATSWRGWHP